MLIALTAAALFVGGYLFAAMVGAVFAGAYREWETMVTRKPLSPVGMVLIGLLALATLAYPLFGVYGTLGIVLIAVLIGLFAGGEAAGWRAAGLLFFGAVVLAALAIRGQGASGIYAGVFLATVIWMTDSAAFFTGRQVGGEKLAPGISPSKTWSGALGGLALGTLAGLAVWIWLTESPWWVGLLLAALTSVLGQAGDLCESAVKRHFRIKDSGDIIPGHGGLMDRLDSLTFGLLFAAVLGAAHMGYDRIADGLLLW